MNAIDKLANIRGGGAWTNDLGAKHPSLEDTLNVSGGYLLNSYDVYLKNEPCLMCAMGLVHSRVRRVFFNKFSSKGGLGTLAKLHTIRELNHAFEVYRVFLQNDV